MLKTGDFKGIITKLQVTDHQQIRKIRNTKDVC